MGLGPSQPSKENFELPSPKHEATLYYFAGRGLADQIRWMLAATNVTFTQKSINNREKMVSMAERQLPFGQLPLLQIDDLEIVQSQAAVRYLAKRGNLCGANRQEEVKCDMIAETVRDLIPLVAQLPFKRNRGNVEEIAEHMKIMKEKWTFIGGRFEAILNSNESKTHLVGNQLTYADVLVAHIITWMSEEGGPEMLNNMPLLVDLQHMIVNMPSVNAFIKSIHYFPLGDEKYCATVSKVLGRKI